MKLFIGGLVIFLFCSTNLFSGPRFEYLGSIPRPEDTGVRKSIFKRGKEILFGKTEEEKIVSPYGVVSDGKGKLYVVDNGRGLVHLFDSEKKEYGQIYKIPKGRLISPVACALDFRGNLYVSDNTWRKIFIFNKKGKFVQEISNPEILNPTGIAIGNNFFLYVVDTNAHKVWVYNIARPHLKPGWVFSFGNRGGNDGEFNFPTHIFIDKNGLVYVTDTMNFRVQIFDENGKFVKKFGEIGDAPGYFSRPKGIAVDSRGNIFVVDALKETVEVFNINNQYLGFLGRERGPGLPPTRNPGEFALPSGISIDIGDKIYVADSYNSRVQIFLFHP